MCRWEGDGIWRASGTLSYPNAAGKAFIRSNAVIEAEAFGCRPNICGSETDSETVQLRR